MIYIYVDYRRDEYVIRIDREDIKRALTNQFDYKNLIREISQQLYEEMRFNE